MDLEVTERDENVTRWWNIKDLDRFLRDIYSFYDAKGLGNVITRNILDLMRVLFIAFMFIVITVVIDWTQLNNFIESNCTGLHEVKVDLFTEDCNGDIPIDFYRLGNLSWSSVAAICLFVLIWMGYLLWFLTSIPRLRSIREFYEQELQVSHRELQTIRWSKLVDKLIAAQKRLRLCTSIEDFDPLTITNIITRKHNFLIALYAEIEDDLAVNIPFLGRRVVLSESLQFNIENIVWAVVFNDITVNAYVLSPQDPKYGKIVTSLANRFKMYGFINWLLSPAILLIRLAYFLFHHSSSLRKSAGPLATRQWSPYACWRMRNYSETEHVFRRRLARSCKPATRYIELFVSEMGTIWGRFLVFVFGGLFVILTGLGFIYDEDFLFAYLTPERSVIWWTGVLGALLAVSSGLIADEVRHDLPQALLAEVRKYTHFFRESWIGREESLDTFDDFSTLFQLKGFTLMEELISIIFLTPYLLMFVLPKISPKIVNFFCRCSYKHPHLTGHFCEYASLKFQGKAEDMELSRQGASLMMESGADLSRIYTNNISKEKSNLNNTEISPDHVSVDMRHGSTNSNNSRPNSHNTNTNMVGPNSLSDNNTANNNSSNSYGSSVKSHNPVKYDTRQDSLVLGTSKLDASVANFMIEHPDWQPSMRSDVSRVASSSSFTHRSHIRDTNIDNDDGVGLALGVDRELSPNTSLRVPLLPQ